MSKSHAVTENGVPEKAANDESKEEWTRPDGSRPWVVHGRICGAKRSDGRAPCKMPAGWGTDHVGYGTCKLHGGSSRGHRVAAARQEMADITSGRFMGNPIDTDPATALLMCVQVAAGHVEYATRQVGAVPEHEGLVESEHGAQLHPWARIQAEALDRLARFTKMAIDCGAQASAVRLAERQGAELARVLTAVLDELGLTEEQRQHVPKLLREQLLGIEADNHAAMIMSDD